MSGWAIWLLAPRCSVCGNPPSFRSLCLNCKLKYSEHYLFFRPNPFSLLGKHLHLKAPLDPWNKALSVGEVSNEVVELLGMGADWIRLQKHLILAVWCMTTCVSWWPNHTKIFGRNLAVSCGTPNKSFWFFFMLVAVQEDSGSQPCMSVSCPDGSGGITCSLLGGKALLFMDPCRVFKEVLSSTNGAGSHCKRSQIKGIRLFWQIYSFKLCLGLCALHSNLS